MVITCFLCATRRAEAEAELKSCEKTAEASAAYRGHVPRQLRDDVAEAAAALAAAREAANLCDFGICTRGNP